MILPQTYGLVVFLIALSLVCWGSWANTFKLAGKYRFEAYYVDFAIGCLLISVIYAFTVGNLGFDGFLFLDDLDHAGKRQWLFAFIAGVIFNLGNMLLTAAMSVGGMSIAFPAAIALALVVNSIIAFILRPSGNIILLFFGCVLLVGSIVTIALANNILGVIRHEVLARAGKAKSTRRPISFKPVALAISGGILIGCFSLLLQKATEGDSGLGPYSAIFMFAVGIFFSTPVYDIFFMNLPVEGEPIEFIEFFRARPRQHLLGMAGGAIWCTGSVAAMAAGAAPAAAQMPPVPHAIIAQAYPLLAALWGLFVWKEVRDGDARVKLSVLVTLVLFLGGLILVSLAPQYAKAAAAISAPE